MARTIWQISLARAHKRLIFSDLCEEHMANFLLGAAPVGAAKRYHSHKVQLRGAAALQIARSLVDSN